MRTLRSVLLIQLATMLSIVAQGQQKDLGRALGLFPGYHLLKLEERDADTRTFLAAHFKKNSPSLVNADFDGDGRPDYALLLKSDNDPKTRMVVVLCPRTGVCKTVYDLDLTGSAGEVYLKHVPAGTQLAQTEAATEGENPRRTRLSSAGARLVYFEKAEVVLYWDRKLNKIVQVETGD